MSKLRYYIGLPKDKTTRGKSMSMWGNFSKFALKFVKPKTWNTL